MSRNIKRKALLEIVILKLLMSSKFLNIIIEIVSYKQFFMGVKFQYLQGPTIPLS